LCTISRNRSVDHDGDQKNPAAFPIPIKNRIYNANRKSSGEEPHRFIYYLTWVLAQVTAICRYCVSPFLLSRTNLYLSKFCNPSVFKAACTHSIHYLDIPLNLPKLFHATLIDYKQLVAFQSSIIN
jgi:hypothetical protein